jgi:hypothetical protein
MKKLILGGLVASLAACSSAPWGGSAYHGPVYVPVGQPRVAPVAALGLQACADHAAAQQASVADDFRVLRFDTERLLALPVREQVGSQPIARVLDGSGARYGAKEYQLVRFHCLQNIAGHVVYSFVRAE